ncbi:MAG: phenylalanine--tRNA ligase subunit beta [Candidatus Heimdallarchaeota archaeon]
MPTITIGHRDLCELTNLQMTLEELKQQLFLMKCEAEVLGATDGETALSVEVAADRIDLLSVEGIAREIKGLTGAELGPPNYPITRSNIVVKLDTRVQPIRPFSYCAIVEGITLDKVTYHSLMQLQERLHESHCRGRRKGAIGVYDLDSLRPPMQYTALPPTEIRFTPLMLESHMMDSHEGASTERYDIMNALEILATHPAGIKYGDLIATLPEFPILMDSKGQVLAMPPIINSEETRVVMETPESKGTRNLFIDISGFDEKILSQALNVIVTSLAERGGTIKMVTMVYPDREVMSPDLIPRTMALKIEHANNLIGLSLNSKEMIECLEMMRFHVLSEKGGLLEVEIPAYRADFLHENDLIEDIAIAYGYDRLIPILPKVVTTGKEAEKSILIRDVRDIMVGMGFIELANYVMTNEEILFDRMELPREPVVEVLNPKPARFSALRNWLLPGALHFLEANIEYPYPQKVFEVGDIVLLDESEETKTRTVLNVAGAICNPKGADLSEIYGVVNSLLTNLGVKYKLRDKIHQSFISGRVFAIIAEQEEVGFFGELHPQVYSVNFQIRKPVAGFELELWKLFAV